MQEQFHDIFTIGNATLHYNPTPKILGITLDEQLNFSTHVGITEKKASRALHVIREVKGIARMSTRNLIRLYVSMVRPILEYGCLVWQTVSQSDLKKLEAVQKKALTLCLSLPSTAALDALEVAAGIPPLELRYREIAIRDEAKIAAKRSTYPLKAKLDEYSQDSLLWNEKYVSPMGMAISQASEMKRITCTGLEFIQPEPEYSDGAFVRSLDKPSYWSQLGYQRTEPPINKKKGEK